MAFFRGFGAIKETMNSGHGLRIDDGERKIVHFLDEEPLGLYEHPVQELGFKRYTCLQGSGEDCPMCERGMKKGSAGYFRILDTTDNRVKTFARRGFKDLAAIEELNKDAPLTKTAYRISRTGKALNTIYVLSALQNTPTTEAMLARKDELDIEKILSPKKRSEILSLLGSNEEDDPVTDFE